MPSPNAETVHATCVAVGAGGVLLTGPSGSGKSDLALRLIDCADTGRPARLVADDRVVLTPAGSRLVASPPPAIAGRLEVRGVGIVRLAHVEAVDLALVIELVDAAEVPRLPERTAISVLGIALPRLRLSAFEASATAKIRAAVRALGGDGFAEDIA